MRTIELTQDKVALVDDSDYEDLLRWKWCTHTSPTRDKTFYAVRSILLPNGARTKLRMHVYLVGKGFDHIDRNGLNNQRLNLRPANPTQQNANRRMPSNNTSGFKGVRWFRNRWRALIAFEKHELFLGSFDSVEDAARAYDAKAIELFGDFAVTNKSLGLL